MQQIIYCINDYHNLITNKECVMIKANEAGAVTSSYYRKGNEESVQWIKEELAKVDLIVKNEASKGISECAHSIRFPTNDIWALARITAICNELRAAGYTVSATEESVAVNDVLKEPITRLVIGWDVKNETKSSV